MAPTYSSADWEVFTRLDRSQYFAKTWAGDDSSERRTVVVDDFFLMTMAADIVQSSPLSCEEVYFLWKDRYLLVFHSSQTAFYSSQQYIDMKTKRKLYWQYITTHPAHAGRSMADWIPEAHEKALVFLQWCSFEAMTSSTAQIPFLLKPSQDLANMLTSLEAKSRPDDAWGGEERGRVYTGANRSRRTDSEPDEKDELVDDQPVPAAETAAQARYRLRTTLIAKVLTEK
ncbi:hypothetical protein C8R44DRAFT_384002 [Mycena epipterygia]|nr:hypothetical protein C8R44DRAFT_384002 [Mycena epipterygia]